MAATLAPKAGAAAVGQLIRARPFIGTTTTTRSTAAAVASCWTTRRRDFSTTIHRPSKLGRMPLQIPQGVEVLVGPEQTKPALAAYMARVTKMITIRGPLGTLQLEVPSFVTVTHNDENRTLSVGVLDRNLKRHMEMWGTTWAYLKNHITGVYEGHTAVLRLVGVGYRASVEARGGKETYPKQPFLCLKVGFTHPVEEGVPQGLTVTTPAPTRVLIEGPDREVVMSFAGRVRKWRPPEPYKGKGIFINDQTIKLKQKKIK